MDTVVVSLFRGVIELYELYMYSTIVYEIDGLFDDFLLLGNYLTLIA